ncbi:MAG TPA: glutathione S-transferase family protein [Steroidobacteraceae bacterium]|jgi:glutathione S-transferase
MLLIGMYDSPFVRRVAISLKLCDIAYEHADWSIGADFERIRQYNPLVRVPSLVLDDGEVLMDSQALLDYLDELVGPQRALLPRVGRERRTALRLMAGAMGAAEKAREQVYERAFRPPEKRHEPWLARCRTQMHGALAELERYACGRGEGRWLVGERMTQADITLVCAFTFLSQALSLNAHSAPYPALRALAARCEALPEFQSTKLDFFVPQS